MDCGGRKLRAMTLLQRRKANEADLAMEELKPVSPYALFMRRMFHRLEARVETLPRFFQTAFATTIVGGFTLYGAALGGHLQAFITSTTNAAGFEVASVRISGLTNLTEHHVLDALELGEGVSLVTFDVTDGLQSLLDLPWVESASLRKLYPNRMEVTLTERQPFAIWQRNEDFVSVIDSEGRVLDDFDGEKFLNLPLLVGYGAEKEAREFLTKLAQFDAIASRVQASILISGRRWDLILDNDVKIKLPEAQPELALTNLIKMDAESDVLSKDITLVDMRLPDRVVMRLSDEAVIQWHAAGKARKKGRGERDT